MEVRIKTFLALELTGNLNMNLLHYCFTSVLTKLSVFKPLKSLFHVYFRRGGEIGETDDETQSGSATDIIGTSEVIRNLRKNDKFRYRYIYSVMMLFTFEEQHL